MAIAISGWAPVRVFAVVERTLRQEQCDGTGDEQRVRLPARGCGARPARTVRALSSRKCLRSRI
jgi:hypothetical protein